MLKTYIIEFFIYFIFYVRKKANVCNKHIAEYVADLRRTVSRRVSFPTFEQKIMCG